MSKVTDNDLILLFYGESTDPGLASRVAESEELTMRFEALCTELKMADALEPPERGEDYGAKVWQKISPRLEHSSENTRSWQNWFSALAQPRFSFAGVAIIAVLTVIAFMAGRYDGPSHTDSTVDSVLVSNGFTTDIDPDRLLTHSVSHHLGQINVMLTEFANFAESSDREAQQATDLLLTNRLYEKAALARGDQKLAVFLAQLEPILLELAYEAQNASPATRARLQKEVNNDLLFRVRVMNQRLGSL